jgi:hypothetical protein
LEAFDPVWEMADTTDKVDPNVVAPDMEAVPPTSSLVSTRLPELMPKLPLDAMATKV